MTAEQIRFSRALRRQQHLRSYRPHLRVVAVILTLGELAVGFVLFRRADFLGAYGVAAYLAKEHLIARFTGKE